MAGAEGFEPPSSVLETDSLTVELTPLCSLSNCAICELSNLKFVNPKIQQSVNLFYFFMRRMLPAAVAKLLKLQPLRHGLPILGGRIIPLLALTALQRNNLSRHKTPLPVWRGHSCPRPLTLNLAGEGARAT
jgi:hypothetical protein